MFPRRVEPDPGATIGDAAIAAEGAFVAVDLNPVFSSSGGIDVTAIASHDTPSLRYGNAAVIPFTGIADYRRGGIDLDPMAAFEFSNVVSLGSIAKDGSAKNSSVDEDAILVVALASVAADQAAFIARGRRDADPPARDRIGFRFCAVANAMVTKDFRPFSSRRGIANPMRAICIAAVAHNPGTLAFFDVDSGLGKRRTVSIFGAPVAVDKDVVGERLNSGASRARHLATKDFCRRSSFCDQDAAFTGDPGTQLFALGAFPGQFNGSFLGRFDNRSISARPKQCHAGWNHQLFGDFVGTGRKINRSLDRFGSSERFFKGFYVDGFCR